MTTLDDQFEKWWNTWKPLDCGKDHAKAAWDAGIHFVLNREPSEAMVLAVLPENESEMGHLMALTCTKVYLAMRAAEKEELGVK